MIRLAWGFVYVLIILVINAMIPAIMIPVLQDYGLYARDVVGFCVLLIFLADIILLAFGAFMWSVLS